jgi:membrane protease YdiL (CAAX protease family)
VAVFIGLNLAVYLLTLLGLLDFGRAAPSADSGAKSTSVDPLFALGVSVAVMGLTAAFVASCATQTTPDALGALGLRLRGLVRALGAALFLAPVAYLVLIGLALVWPLALNAIGIEDVVQPVARMLVDVPREQRAVAAIAGIAVIPFFEELIFRGFLQPALERHVRPWLAIFLTSLAFGAMHGVAAVVPIAGLSLVLGYARQRTGSVWAAFALHAVNNSLAFYLLWFGPASPAA